jgi:hypothetical protein
VNEVHKVAAYYEPLFRARVARAMRRLRSRVTLEQLVRAIRLGDTHPIPQATIKTLLEPAAQVIRDAVRQGGRIGAEKVRKL